MHAVELAPHMGPAVSQHDLALGALGHEPIEALEGVDLEDAAEVGKVLDRIGVASTLGIDIGRGRRRGALPWPVVTGIAPEPCRLGSAASGLEHRQRRVIGKDLRRRQDVREQTRVEEIQPPGGAADPIRECRAVEIDALAGEDLRLAVERQVIGILADKDMGDERLGRHPAVERADRGRRLHDGALAGPAAIARPADDPDLELGRYDIELLADILADHVQHAAAAGTALVRGLDDDLFARQMLGQSPPVAPRGRAAALSFRAARLDRLLRCLGHAERLFEVFKGKLPLVRVELLRAPTELGALELLDQEPQPVALDLVGIALGAQARHLRVPLRNQRITLREQAAQSDDLVGGVGQRRVHDAILPNPRRFFHAKLSRATRPSQFVAGSVPLTPPRPGVPSRPAYANRCPRAASPAAPASGSPCPRAPAAR